MKTVHYIVHPEYAIQHHCKSTILTFTDALEEVAKEDHVFAIKSKVKPFPKTHYFQKALNRLQSEELVGESNVFTSNHIMHPNLPKISYGHVTRESWDAFDESREEATNFVVHGCYLGNVCLSSFATQLYGLVKHNKHWFDWEQPIPEEKAAIIEAKRADRLELTRALQRFGRITYGKVFSCENIFETEEKKRIFTKGIDEQISSLKPPFIYGT